MTLHHLPRRRHTKPPMRDYGRVARISTEMFELVMRERTERDECAWCAKPIDARALLALLPGRAIVMHLGCLREVKGLS